MAKSKAEQIDFGSWTREDMKDLLRRLLAEMSIEDYLEVLEEENIL